MTKEIVANLMGDSQGSVLKISNVSKTFGGTRALDAVDLDVRAGEVHAVVGQNGSGKSTLVKILSGFHTVDDGDRTTVTMDGQPLHLHDPAASRAAGLRFVHQELGLVPTLSAVENLALGNGFRTGAAGCILWKQERRNAEERLAALGYSFDVEAPVQSLLAAERTGIAIARALCDAEDARILVIDEPTATLPNAEVDVLFDVIRRVQAGGTGVIYISHHLPEVFALSDRVTVLRDGRRVGTYRTAEMDKDRLVTLMVGDQELRVCRPRDAQNLGAPSLRADDVCGATVLEVTLAVAGGEILGVAGLTGSGRDELLSLLFGAAPRTGTVRVGAAELVASRPAAAIAAGIGFVPPDRHRQGSLEAMTIRDNCTLTDLRRHSGRLGLLNSRSEQKEVEEWIHALDIRPASTEAVMGELSGGNQQKVMLAKWLRLKPVALLLDEPTQGVDVGAKAAIHGLTRDIAHAGTGVLIASSDEDELCDVCDRIVVMRKGAIVGELRGDEGTPKKIVQLQQ